MAEWVSELIDNADSKLVNAQQQAVDKTVLTNKRFVALYFSAHWCPPCKQFTPTLVRAYNSIREADGNNNTLEIVFVTSDRSSDQQFEYMTDTGMPWVTLPHGDPSIAKLKAKYEVRSIPTLIFLDGATGQVVSRNGRDLVTQHGANVLAHL
eukprot:TRINITY_DN1461_c0_g1_i1.p1 TRINITY_DN1461_c0_g1~~TRINITY_DN1461_c0_g1_i1.p1  ORF type:complete len:159 (-),score=30.18 TRINITY_DN1461_c0_g1_i1:131-586(-)